MKEAQKNTVLSLFIRSIEAIIDEKRMNPKYTKKLNRFDVKINFGLQIEKDEYIWFNFVSNDGKVETNQGRLKNNYDLVIMSVPEDLMFFTNRENSLSHMLLKKNKFGKRKLHFKKGATGWNLMKLLKVPGMLTLDKN